MSYRERQARIEDLIKPIASLFPKVSSVKSISSKSEHDCFCDSEQNHLLFPYGYSKDYNPGPYSYYDVHKALTNCREHSIKIPFIDLPLGYERVNYLESLSCDLQHQITQDCVNKNPHYLTLTLRDYGFSPARNTTQYDVDQAYAFALSQGLVLVIVPDDPSNLSSYSLPAQAIVSSKARSSLLHRASLYSESVVNIFPPSGPAQLSLFIRKSKTIIVNFGAGGSDGDYNYYRQQGLIPDSQPFHVLGGHLLWSSSRSTYTNKSLELAFKSLESL